MRNHNTGFKSLLYIQRFVIFFLTCLNNITTVGFGSSVFKIYILSYRLDRIKGIIQDSFNT